MMYLFSSERIMFDLFINYLQLLPSKVSCLDVCPNPKCDVPKVDSSGVKRWEKEMKR